MIMLGTRALRSAIVSCRHERRENPGPNQMLVFAHQQRAGRALIHWADRWSDV